MIFGSTEIEGVSLIDIEPQLDERGFFARLWCQRELTENGLDAAIVQESISHNRRQGTLRGLHLQRTPYEEAKIVRCAQGAIFDVVVDLRSDSRTFQHWQGFELTAENYRAVYIPKGVAHGFQTLVDHSEVVYRMSTFHTPQAVGGYRYNDPAFEVLWPLPVSVISDRDLAWPAFDDNLMST